MLAVPVTVPVLALNEHEDDTAVMSTDGSRPSRPPTATSATLDEALVGPAVSVAAPMVARPRALTRARDTGDVPG
jgi:hypothetical protein